jgi:hypothetical protein
VKSILSLATILFVFSPAAFAQEPTSSVGSLRLLGPAAPAAPPATPAASDTPAAPPATPAPTAIAAVAPVDTPISAPVIPATQPAATGWKGAVNFAPVAIADLISHVCRPSDSADGGDIGAHALKLGLGAPQPAAENLVRALPDGAVTWHVPTIDGVLVLMGYGEEPMKCGAAIVRPMHEVAFNKVLEMLQEPDMGFVPDSSQTLEGNVRWARLKSAKGEFVDLMEYPPLGDDPGVLRADFLPN